MKIGAKDWLFFRLSVLLLRDNRAAQGRNDDNILRPA
jgi:hypothetical protein